MGLYKGCSRCSAERRLENDQRAQRPLGGCWRLGKRGVEGRRVAEKWKGDLFWRGVLRMWWVAGCVGKDREDSGASPDLQLQLQGDSDD